ncbi:SWR1 complex subunit 6 [Raphidocelis subcapitata]|uniref:SWR1 complex subunit 6 n=1 Tax=Raphidocelis subcapitata TaxID=307507 RepID=A0A2V0PCB0_9CHLO|nr:SWR1 complex subunit 6 [Raphidocelis subcapitata]|eukprot:GBF97491.1 SWR1 complex subunit 6 [Raphidocelis subcapitata]
MFGKQKAAADGGGRRNTRSRKVSQRMAVVDHASRAQAARARLDALENDNADGAGDPFGLGEDDDDEFVLGSDGEEELPPGSQRKRKGGPKRKTRAMLAESKTPKTFARLLEDSGLEAQPAGVPSYLTAAVGPPTTHAARKFCTVCGFESPYTCVRCGSRFCSKRCYVVHTETRCLKFIS